jgi:hypothetical protein
MGGYRIMTRRAYRKSRTRKVRKLSHFAVDFAFRDSTDPCRQNFPSACNRGFPARLLRD